jgi:hypothetical protein
MVLQFEQKFRSEEQRCSSGVPRSFMAEYFLVMMLVYAGDSYDLPIPVYEVMVSRWILCSKVKVSGYGWVVLDQIFALDDIQAIGDGS